MVRQKHPDWIYFLPILHFCACLMSMLQYIVPGLQYLEVMWEFVVRADFPLSLLADALAAKHAVLAGVWIVAAGTLWWYLLSRAAESVCSRLARRRNAVSD